ncbi:MAG: cytochrome c oxidase subunit 3 [Minwuia sp.]|nr:cytochrome c oxidase subunit 3 [Minwuia sp.]
MSNSPGIGALPLLIVLSVIAAATATGFLALPPLLEYWLNLRQLGAPAQPLVLDWPRLLLLSLIPAVATALLWLVLLSRSDEPRWLVSCLGAAALALLFAVLQLVRHTTSFDGPTSIATQVLFTAEGWHGFAILFAIAISLLASLLGMERFSTAPGSRIAGVAVAWYWTFVSLLWLVLLLSWRGLQTG